MEDHLHVHDVSYHASCLPAWQVQTYMVNSWVILIGKKEAR
jgi:hypothetical protein